MENKKEEKKIDTIEKNKIKKKIIKLTFVIVMLVVLLLSTYHIIEDNNNKSRIKKEQEQERLNEKKKIILYKDKSKDERASYGRIEKERCDKCEKIIIRTETETAEVITTASTNSVLYRDNGLKIYDTKSGETKKIDLNDEYDIYELIYKKDIYNENVDDTEYYLLGIAYYNLKDKSKSTTYSEENSYITNIETSGFFNIKTGEKMYEEEKYLGFDALNDRYIAATRYGEKFSAEEDLYTYDLIDTNEEKKIIHKEVYAAERLSYGAKEKNGKTYFNISNTSIDFGISTIYTESAKEIAKDIWDDSWFVDKNGDLNFADSEYVYKYDSDGNQLSKSKKYNKIDFIFMKDEKINVVYFENNKLKIDMNNVAIEFIDVPANCVIAHGWSHYNQEDKTLYLYIYNRSENKEIEINTDTLEIKEINQ